jgi:stage V sporulation protein D (sporulation-specific penicillin-binding protein)
MKKSNLKMKKRLIIELTVFCIGFFIILIKLAYVQFIKGKEYSAAATEQLNASRTINANRGFIYDCNGIILAQSSTVYTVTINPAKIAENNKEKVARKLAEIFDLEYEETLEKTKKNVSIVNIAKKVDKELVDDLREWIDETDLGLGINIDEDTKRYYPFGSLASHVIGFCGSDNQGLDGIEAKYDETLKGENGYINRAQDGKGIDIGTDGEEYIEPISGDSLVLTIDMNIQSIVEKYLEEACIDNVCTDGGSILIMNPKNGDILAMANYPDYDLNNPYTITDSSLLSVWDSLEQSGKSTYLQAMWRNKAISDTYEPGSCFKLVTASSALEEGIVSGPDNAGEFSCTGGIEIAGVRIKCWRYYRPHGAESLREALMNSCNPVFIGLGQKIGISKYYEYLEKFGFLRKTGIDIYGEAGSIFLKEDKVGAVELATISFGQRFEVTPIQMITMVSTIANNGVYVYPRLVKATIDSQTGIQTDIEPKFGDRVISEDTAKTVLSMMNSVVSEGTGKNARVEGYSVGGKTGTSEDGVNTGKYVTSFIGVAPTEDPQVAILITLYNPTGEGGHQGGGVAAPIAGQILGEVLPYLELPKSTEDETLVKVPNVVGMTLKEAKEILKDFEIQVISESEYTQEVKVLKQIPEAEIEINSSGEVVLYVE